MKTIFQRIPYFIMTMSVLMAVQGCGKTDFLGKKATPLMIEEVDPATIGPIVSPDPADPQTPENGKKDPDNTSDITLRPVGGLHPIFSTLLGSTIPQYALGLVDADPTGIKVENDWDGDGVENAMEVMSGAMVADYPHIVSRISTPIVMELRKSETATGENYTEVIDNTDTKQTITNSMENRHYAQMNQKTTPYVTKESQSSENADAYSYGSAYSNETDMSVSIGLPVISPLGAIDVANNSTSTSVKSSNSQNFSISNKFAQSTMSEKTVFQDVDYVDNLDRNGIEFKDEKIQNMTTNFRKSEKTKESYEVGPNAGFVRAGLYLKNDTVNMPVRISNVICTLSFRTAGGAILPVKTFRLRNDDYSEFDQEVYGGEELGPYTIEVTGLNTFEVKQALANGYMPQITVVNYDMTRVDDSNYNPGVDNLKIVEETAKARTALIKIVGANTREIYRVAAFDVAADGSVSPGISLKKALFHIYGDSIGKGERWEEDNNGRVLTVSDANLKWKKGSAPDPDNPDDYEYSTSNRRGNSWRLFETYVKSYIDEYNRTRRIETIKRIGPIKAYNPFDIIDNTTYNPNEYLEREELLKMKYWIILHNGRYFEGDLNDPIWAGERYEIVCMDIRDFNEYFKACSFTPVQSREYFTMDTSWNRLKNEGEFARARYLGRIVKNDVVHLELNLAESRFLFGNNSRFLPTSSINNHYTLQTGTTLPEGIPAQFSHYAEGGFNNIKVTINESLNAQKYEITFKPNYTPKSHVCDPTYRDLYDPSQPECDPGYPYKKIIISADELKRNNGEVFINSRSIDVDNKEIGLINGKLLSQGGYEYIVNVKAIGMIKGVPVYALSMSNNKEDALASVYNVVCYTDKEKASLSTRPGGKNGFTFSAAGLADNWIYVRVADADYTEYFNIKVTGPYNYPNNGYSPPLDNDTAPVIEFMGHRGLNKIQMANPPGDVMEPGIYKVEVFAINNNSNYCNLGQRQANNEYQYITLAHDRYAAQRVYKPALSGKLFDVDSIDLEVNFNNGDGWHRLKLEGSDTANLGPEYNDVYGTKMIDCRFHSYVDFDTQRMHIYFKAPTGTNDEYSKLFANSHNAFFGGRETVDLYIRTPADMVYRDTFWAKAQPAFTPDVSVNPPDWLTPIMSWLNLTVDDDTTDASSIEDTLENTLPAVAGFNGTDLNNYFFSPVEYRKFDIRASLAEKLPDMATNAVDLPRFSVAGGCGTIELTNIGSRFADAYEIYYRRVNPTVQSAPYLYTGESPLSWNMIPLEPAQQNQNQLLQQTISGSNISAENRYLVAVIGYNRYGRSEPSYWTGAGNIMVTTGEDAAKVVPVEVYDCTPPGVPTFSIDLTPGNNRSINVNTIQATRARRFRIEWKPWDSSSWSSFDTGILSSNTYPLFTTGTLQAWKRYQVRVLSYNLHGEACLSYSDIQERTTGTSYSLGTPTLEWRNVIDVGPLLGGGWEKRADLALNISIPEGSLSYSIDGNVTQYRSNTMTGVGHSFNSLLVWDDALVGESWGPSSWHTDSVSGTFNITLYNDENVPFTLSSIPIEIGSPQDPE